VIHRIAGLVAALCIMPATVLADTFTHDGRSRDYILEVPDGLSLPAPTVFVLHGGTRSASKIRRSTDFHDQGEISGFVTVYPEGIGGHWHDAREAAQIIGKQGGKGADDVGFLTTLAGRLTAEGVADPRRIYVTGSSNGGMMSFRLACEAADVFAAFAPVIASLPEKAEHSCKPVRPVPLLMINGTDDKLIPWEGGRVAPMTAGQRGRVLPVMKSMEMFHKLNGCAKAESQDAHVPGDPYTIPLFITRYAGCGGGSELGLYRFDGMGHRWPESARPWYGGIWDDIVGPAPTRFPAAEHIWAFFARHRLPE
jgi:polyhydroxybutyrate depolymerase